MKGPQKIVDHAESVLLQRLVIKIATIAGLILGALGGIFTVETALTVGVIVGAVGGVVWIVESLYRGGYKTIVEKAFIKLQKQAEVIMNTQWKYTGNIEGQSHLWVEAK